MTTVVVINGHTYSDDADPGTGLAAGGHRTRFVPALADVVVVAGQAAASASTATTQAGIATTQAGQAAASASTATTQAGIAATQAGIAATQAGAASASAAAAALSESNANAIAASGLPAQTGHAGQALITNGALISWAAPAPAAHTHPAADLPPTQAKSYFFAGW